MADKNLQIQKMKRQAKRNSTPRVKNILKPDIDFTDPPKGERYCTCSDCGRKFEQVLDTTRNRYSNFNRCPSCRKKIANSKNGSIKESEQTIATLPFKPFPWQKKAGEDFEKCRFMVIDAGNRCFTKGAFINGCDKFVEDVQAGDFSFDGNGNRTKITKVESETVTENFYTIKSLGRLPFEVTEDHLIYVSSRNPETGEFYGKYVTAEWLYNELNSDCHAKMYLSSPMPKPWIDCDYWEFEKFEKNYKNQIDGIPLNEDTAWLFGLYCAEGCFLERAGSKLTLNYQDKEVQEKAIRILQENGYHPNVRERPDEGTTCVVVSKMQYARKLDKEIGHGSANKQIPSSVLYNKNKNILISFLKGYYAGDGYMNQRTGYLVSQTVSKKLAIQLQTAWLILGFNCNLSITDRRNKRRQSKNVDYMVVQNDESAYNLLGYVRPKRPHAKKFFVVNDTVYTEVSKIDRIEKRDEIFKLCSESSELCANCTKNHNCGKDRMTIMTGIKYFAECLNENRHIDNPDMVPSVLWWQIAPTEKIARQNWRELKKYMPKDWVVACSDSTYTMETICGGIIEVRSAYDPEGLVGVGLDLVTITEAARIADLQTVWANLEARLNSPGRGREKDRNGKKYGCGKAIINSSPIGKNYFYDLYKFGQKTSDTYSSNWISYKLGWRENPYMNELADTIVHTKYGDMTYEEDLRRKIGDRLFKQNYLGDFLAMDGSVFKDFSEKCVKNLFDMGLNKQQRDDFARQWKEPVPYHAYRIGYDPATGSSSDTPAVVVRDMNTNDLVAFVDLYGKNYDRQWDEIAYVSKYYNYAPCTWLRTGHTAVENQLAKRGVVEIPLDEQAGKKAQYIQSLERAIQNGDLHVLNDGTETVQTFIMQMEDYSEHDGKYSNESQPHDDFVSACYAAYYDYTDATEKIFYCGLMGGINRYGKNALS